MRVLFAGGGTMGSVTPLLAVAEALRAREPRVELRWWGTAHGPERPVVTAAGIPFRSLPAGKLRRYWDIRNIGDPFIVLCAFMLACARLLMERPHAVVGGGGYVQVPVLWAAWVFRIPSLVHQQDVRPGLANRLVAWCAAAITVTFPETAAAMRHRSAVVVGNPVRTVILAARGITPDDARRRFGFTSERPTVLVLGGGTGAVAINTLVWAAAVELAECANIIHVTGRGKSGSEISNLKSHIANFRSFEFLTDDLPYAYAASDLVVSRAGMGTITELVALGLPAVLIPMPGTHQEENVAAMAARGAMDVWDERDLTPPIFADRVRAIIADASLRARLRASVRRAFPTESAAGAIADRVASITR